MINRISLLTSLLVLASIPSCDAADECDVIVDAVEPGRPPVLPLADPVDPDGELPAPAAVTFREEGPPEMWVITKWMNSAIATAIFAKHTMVCIDVHDPTWTCTFSARQPDLAVPNRVIGLGCSAWAPPPLYACLRDAYLASGAIKYQ